MNNSPYFDSDEMYVAYNYRMEPYKQYKYYEGFNKEFQNEKEKFNKIDLNKYKNKDGTYTVTKLERPLGGKNSKIGKMFNKINKNLHHEGLAIGNEQNQIIIDYGKKNKILDFDVKESNNLNDWTKKTQIQIISAEDIEMIDKIFGNDAQKWVDPKGYHILKHNCQDFVKNLISKLNEKSSES